jgi:hypothetical protein
MTAVKGVVVVHIISPDEFYVMSTAILETYASILAANRSAARRPLPSAPQVGQLCLAEERGELQRAKVEKISPYGEKVKLFFIDIGHRAIRAISDLHPLAAGGDIPSLARRVALAGLKAGAEGWTAQMLSDFAVLTDVENRPSTVFHVETVGWEEEGGLERVKMVDADGNDLAELCLDMEIGAPAGTGHLSLSAPKGTEYHL